MDMAWKLIITFACTTLLMIVVFINGHPCNKKCPNSYGHVINCSLNSPNHLIRSKNTISQLQCFDMCVRQPGCEFYNYIKEAGDDSCQLFRGLWSFDDQDKMVVDPGVTFTWIARDRYLQWLSPDCTGVKCFASNDSLIGSCKKPLDIVFLLDTSIPIPGEVEFKLEKKFVSKVLQRFEQSSRYTKAAIVEYSTNAVVSFSFNNFTTPSGFENYLQKISCKAGQTRYDRALHLAESQLFSSQGGARPFAHRVVVLITNNEINHDADDTYKIENLKNACKKKCIQIFAVGIELNGKKAASIVADTSDGHLLQVDSFNDLAAQASQFSNKICAALD